MQKTNGEEKTKPKTGEKDYIQQLQLLRLRWLGHVVRMPGERVARQVLFGQLRGTRPVGSSPVTLRGLMRKDVLLLNGGGGQVHGRRWYQECMEKTAWRTSVDSVF
jgi:hypothetical protein